ncbi:MAG: phosphatidate cytidylyltransferase [bacterium]
MWKKNSTAGRIIIGICLGLIVAGAILSGNRLVLTILVSAWIALATLEFLNLLHRAEIYLNLWLLLFLNLVIIIAAHLDLLPGFLIVPVAVVFITAIARRPALPRIPVYGLFTIIYLGFLPSHIILLRNLVHARHYSAWLVLFPLILTWVSDTAAYALGKAFGRHKLVLELSPNKTLEGFVAGLFFSALLAALWLPILNPFTEAPRWWLALIGVGLSALGQAGDLFESLFKRAVSVKDSSETLGAHGGFLDRIDSLLFTIPGFYYLALLVAK